MEPILEPDPSEAAYDDVCPVCGSKEISLVRHVGRIPVTIYHGAKRFDWIEKNIYVCESCLRHFTYNKYISD